MRFCNDTIIILYTLYNLFISSFIFSRIFKELKAKKKVIFKSSWIKDGLEYRRRLPIENYVLHPEHSHNGKS